jgi:ribose/xylose/arabinose/galactoside ABC-type transport system permease subunit
MGGVNIWGGRGSVYGTVAAVLIVAVLGNTLDLLGMSTYVVSLMKGFLLMGIVMLYYERG